MACLAFFEGSLLFLLLFGERLSSKILTSSKSKSSYLARGSLSGIIFNLLTLGGLRLAPRLSVLDCINIWWLSLQGSVKPSSRASLAPHTSRSESLSLLEEANIRFLVVWMFFFVINAFELDALLLKLRHIYSLFRRLSSLEGEDDSKTPEVDAIINKSF